MITHFLVVYLFRRSDHQWSAPKESVKTGGPNWQRQNLQPKTLQPGESKGGAIDWSRGVPTGHFPLNNTMQPAPQMMGTGGMGMMTQSPMMMGPRQPTMMGGGMQQPPMGGMMMGGGMYQQQQTMMGQPFMVSHRNCSSTHLNVFLQYTIFHSPGSPGIAAKC